MSKAERHNERKNETYENMNVIVERIPFNVHFKKPTAPTYMEQLKQMETDGQVSLRGLRKDATLFDEIVIDVNTMYFERNGGYEYAKDIISMPDDFDIENYTKEVFFMFSGEKVLVDLRCDNSLMKTMVDRFGEDVTTLAYDMTSFRVQTEVSASPTFFGWVFGFNGKVQILAPESVKEQYRQMIAQADEGMQESE